MKDLGEQLARNARTAGKVGLLLRKRLEHAGGKYRERLATLAKSNPAAGTMAPMALWSQMAAYGADAVQRAILVADTLRERGNNFIAHAQAGKPPLLHFDYTMVEDARSYARPVNYALVKIVPPDGVTIDDTRRPYIIIDPRAGHGPGSGGFKDDSQVGVALAEGHPVYFVIFFPEPMPGQTLLDVTDAQRQFVARVRALHPTSAKPAIVGNCQGGWAAMMLAAADPEQSGPLVINGAPMSYWGGACSGGAGDNPMRYAGGLLGGSWLASLAADLGHGKFDGAWLVQNFESLNPANTFWTKYYNLYAHVDGERPRFLAFERWWGGFYLMNREEIEWISQNLFVGNTLWRQGVRANSGRTLDLREIRSPIVLFASMGDNITPPQQAFNWVADVYGSTEEIKARGQVIVGLLHEDVGHLGIFVSGKVARKEHRQIVSVLKSIESLPPGLWAMQISEQRGARGTQYDVQFVEKRLEDLVARLNRLKRDDEKPFEAVAKISEFNQRAYELFARPLVQAMTTETAAQAGREYHPLRLSRWAWSDVNPALWWLPAAAQWAQSQRAPLADDHPLRQLEGQGAEAITATLDYWRDLRDAFSEASFFLVYGPLFGAYLADDEAERADRAERAPADDGAVQAALRTVDRGGLAEAIARTAVMLASDGEPLPLARLQRRADLQRDYADLLPAVSADAWRRLRGTQEIIVRHDPAQALATLPSLLARADDRRQFLALFRALLADPRLGVLADDSPQRATFARIEALLDNGARLPRARKASRQPATRRRR
ncbi:MAG: DUF3141 domain-containing protein [Burkholderiaceae bacterium]|nr:DUF3141 domain-containing protein [Burkholderiaceae bacterium]